MQTADPIKEEDGRERRRRLYVKSLIIVVIIIFVIITTIIVTVVLFVDGRSSGGKHFGQVQPPGMCSSIPRFPPPPPYPEYRVAELKENGISDINVKYKNHHHRHRHRHHHRHHLRRQKQHKPVVRNSTDSTESYERIRKYDR